MLLVSFSLLPLALPLCITSTWLFRPGLALSSRPRTPSPTVESSFPLVQFARRNGCNGGNSDMDEADRSVRAYLRSATLSLDIGCPREFYQFHFAAPAPYALKGGRLPIPRDRLQLPPLTPSIRKRKQPCEDCHPHVGPAVRSPPINPRTSDAYNLVPHADQDLSQNHLTRHSPPVQPGEQQSNNVGLPSFQQLLNHVKSGEPSPPRTPNRSYESARSSPVARGTQWEEVTWGADAHKRRRLDASDGYYRSHQTPERLDYDPRRPSVIDPALSDPYGSSRQAYSLSSAHHRASLPSVAPKRAPLAAHMRHQSSPAPQGHLQHYAAPPYPHVGASSAYPTHVGSYDRRPSYYSEPQTTVHGHHAYERSQSQYFPSPPPGYVAQATHPTYEGAYHPHGQVPAGNSYTFQSTLGVDQHSFNRRRRGNLPKPATAILKKWFNDHRDSPYPTEEEKTDLSIRCDLSMSQVSNWFINQRRRAPKDVAPAKAATSG